MSTTGRARNGPMRRALGATVAAGLLATGLVAVAGTASAEPQGVSAGGLDWGVKEGFRGYVTGTIGHGTITVGDGASVNGDGTFHFPADTAATFDSASGTPTAAFRGSVHFSAHDGLLDVEISDIRIRYEGGTGSLIADVVSVPFEGVTPPAPPSVTYDDVVLATVSGSTWSTSATSASWSGATTTLTADGAPAFGGFYTAGTALDPVSFALTLVEAEPEPEPATPVLTWKVSQQAWTSSSLSPAHEAGAPAVLGTDGWEFPASATSYDPATGATTLDLDGSLTLGNVNQGGYRVKLAEPVIVVDADGNGTLSADVSYCTGTAACASPGLSTPQRVTVVTFTVPEGAVTDTGSHVSWTVTPDYPSQNDPSWPAFGQFPQSFLDILPPSLQGHFKDSLSGGSPSSANANKPPAPLSVSFGYEPVVTPPGGVVQHITTEVLGGGLSISVADDSVTLPSPTLASDGSILVTSGAINPVTVIDLRASGAGWNVQGQVGDFTGTAGTIAGSGLGWTPNVVSQSAGQSVTAGSAVSAGVAGGLSSSSVLGSSTAGASRGTAVLGAGLELKVPTTTPPGTYTATLTLTVI